MALDRKKKSNRLINGVQIKDFFSYRYGNKIGHLYQKKLELRLKLQNKMITTGQQVTLN